MKTTDQIMDLVDTYMYSRDLYNNSQTCSSEYYKEQFEEMESTRTVLVIAINELTNEPTQT